MKQPIKLGFVLLFIVIVGRAQAFDSLPPEYQVCVVCHGDKAQGIPKLSAPSLSGMEAWYIERQLMNFKSGIRGNSAEDIYGRQMATVVTTLSKPQIEKLAQALAALPHKSSLESVNGNAQVGKKYYLSNCAACHGNNAQGNHQLNAPALSHLESNYMTRQINNFIKGIRGAHQDDKLGRQMAMMARTLPNEKAVVDVIAFIKSL